MEGYLKIFPSIMGGRSYLEDIDGQILEVIPASKLTKDQALEVAAEYFHNPVVNELSKPGWYDVYEF